MEVTILYGSETGNAEDLADRATKHLNAQGITTSYKSMEDIKAPQLAELDVVLIITSTWGDGDPPTNAIDLWEALNKKPDINLASVRFAVLGLGDTSYPEFCKCGVDFDNWLGELGGQRLLNRVDCDLDFEEPYEKWIKEVAAILSAQPVG